MKILFFNFLIFFVFIGPTVASLEPWSISKNHPVISREEIPRAEPAPAKAGGARDDLHAFDYGFHAWTHFLTRADGARCGMYPTCSHYGFQAIGKHGPVLGGWMATDRFMRDHGRSPELYTWIQKFGKTYLSDPVSDNDFWISP